MKNYNDSCMLHGLYVAACTVDDLKCMDRVVRESDIQELSLFTNRKFYNALYMSWLNSDLCYAVKKSIGDVVFISGVSGDKTNDYIGEVWLVGSKYISRHAKGVVSVSNFLLKECFKHFRYLYNFVSTYQMLYIRWLRMMKFTFHPHDLVMHNALGLFNLFYMHNLSRKHEAEFTKYIMSIYML